MVSIEALEQFVGVDFRCDDKLIELLVVDGVGLGYQFEVGVVLVEFGERYFLEEGEKILVVMILCLEGF